MPQSRHDDPAARAGHPTQADAAAAAVHAALDAAHRSTVTRASAGALPAGTFPVTSPYAVVIVVDANHLRDEIVRRARGNGPTVLFGAAAAGKFKVFCARHVLEEVVEHLHEWAQAARVDPVTADRSWLRDVAPLLRVVDVPVHLLTAEERTRLVSLCRDADDRPTAALAILLGATLLGRDQQPLAAVYGPGFDHLDHGAHWLRRLRSAGDLVVLREQSAVVQSLAGVALHGAAAGIGATRRRVPAPVLAIAAVVSLVVLARALRARAPSVGRAASAWGPIITAVSEVAGQARMELDRLTPSAVTPADLRQQSIEGRIARAALRVLAGATGPLDLSDVTHQVRAELPRVGRSAMVAALGTLTCVARTKAGQFQLGVPWNHVT